MQSPSGESCCYQPLQRRHYHHRPHHRPSFLKSQEVRIHKEKEEEEEKEEEKVEEEDEEAVEVKGESSC